MVRGIFFEIHYRHASFIDGHVSYTIEKIASLNSCDQSVRVRTRTQVDNSSRVILPAD
jgi:hypothetical protein